MITKLKNKVNAFTRRIKKFLACFVATAMLISSMVSGNMMALAASSGSITGTIYEQNTMTQIRGATVSLDNGMSITTDESGKFSFSGLNAGTYNLTCTAQYFQPGTASYTLTEASPNSNYNMFYMVPSNGPVSGTITNSDTGNPIQGATVSMGGWMATTDAAGHYSFGSFPAGLGGYTIAVTASNYNLGSQYVNANAVNVSPTVNMQLTPIKGTVLGIITDQITKQPIQGVTVDIGGGMTATTNAAGVYSFTGLTMGSYTVNLSATGYTSGSGSATLTSASQSATANQSLAPLTNSISGTISTNGICPVSGATVKLSNGLSTTTDDSGYYYFTGLSLGTYTVTVQALTYYSGNSGSATLSISNTNKSVNISLSGLAGSLTATFTGTITDAKTGSPISNANVLIRGASVYTNINGHYSFTGKNLQSTNVITVTANNYITNNSNKVIATTANQSVITDISLTPITGMISGNVKSALSNAPLQGVTVKLYNSSGTTNLISTITTDASGNYSFSNLDIYPVATDGNYTVEVSYPSYSQPFTISEYLNSSNHNYTNINFSLLPVCILTGDITNELTGEPINMAGFYLDNSQGSGSPYWVYEEYYTDSNGFLNGNTSLNPRGVGSYSYTAYATGYVPENGSFIFSESDFTNDLHIKLNPIQIIGQVTDTTTGNPIQGATVDVGGDRTTTTDATGNYSFYTLSLGDYTVSASATGYTSENSSTTLTTAAPYQTVNLTLAEIPAAPPTGSISGQIIDAATGSPIQGATVDVGGDRTTTTDATGNYSFYTLSLGDYTVNASATGYTSGTGGTTLTPSDTDQTVNIALAPITGTVSGRVTLSDGTPLVHVKIELHSIPQYAFTDDNGYYSFSNVELGDHTVFINDDHFTQLADNYKSLKVIISVGENNSAVTTYTSGNIDTMAASLSLSSSSRTQDVDFIASLKTQPAVQPEAPFETPTPNPHTGDGSHLPIMFVGIGLDAAILGTIIVRKKILKRGK